jgi:hypothetical protein
MVRLACLAILSDGFVQLVNFTSCFHLLTPAQ